MIKLILLGDARVGKTSLLQRYFNNQFNPFQDVTTTIDSQSKRIDENTEVQIWDTAGQEQYRSINRLYFRDTKCCILVHSLQPNESNIGDFSTLDYWVQEFIQSTASMSNSFQKGQNDISKDTSEINSADFKQLETARNSVLFFVICNKADLMPTQNF